MNLKKNPTQMYTITHMLKYYRERSSKLFANIKCQGESEERMCKSCLTTSFMNNFNVTVKVRIFSMQTYYV